MRKAIHTKQVTFTLSETDFEKVKQITDDEEISMADWFRQATALKFKNYENKQGDKGNDN